MGYCDRGLWLSYCLPRVAFLSRNWYKGFYVIHVILAIFFVVWAWFHVIELGFWNFMYASFAVWTFYRWLQLGKLLYFGFPKAKINFLGENLKVIIPRASHWKSVSDGYAWLYFGEPNLFLQSHPFTYIRNESTVTFYCKVHSGAPNRF